MTNSSCGIKNKWCWKKTFLLLNLCNGCQFAYHYSYWIFPCSNVFVWSLLLIFLLPKLTFNWLWLQCSYHTSFSKCLKQNDVFFLFKWEYFRVSFIASAIRWFKLYSVAYSAHNIQFLSFIFSHFPFRVFAFVALSCSFVRRFDVQR